jgi:hypothetical protein
MVIQWLVRLPSQRERHECPGLPPTRRHGKSSPWGRQAMKALAATIAGLCARPWDALYAFYLEHPLCSGLDSSVEGERVWMACECGAEWVRSFSERSKDT